MGFTFALLFIVSLAPRIGTTKHVRRQSHLSPQYSQSSDGKNFGLPNSFKVYHQRVTKYLIFSDARPLINLSAAISLRSIISASSCNACFSFIAFSYLILKSFNSPSMSATSLSIFSSSRLLKLKLRSNRATWKYITWLEGRYFSYETFHFK